MKTEKQWYHLIFHLPYDKEKNKYTPYVAMEDSPAHYLIVNEILYPLMKKHWNQMPLWRFHRMFLPKYNKEIKMGPFNQLKFKFYCSSKCFCNIRDQLNKLNDLYLLREAGIVEKLDCIRSSDSNHLPGSDHDDNWPYDMKIAWPYYIHGVSLAWLRMIRYHYNRLCKEDYNTPSLYESISECLRLYHCISYSIAFSWYGWANHAMFHHCSGVFGYNEAKVGWKKKNVKLKYSKKFWKGEKRIVSGTIKF